VTIFDLLFLVGILASAVTLITVTVLALRGRGAQAVMILRNFGICAGIYLATSVAFAAFAPQRVIRLGDPWCFDDWCISVKRVDRVLNATLVDYNIGLRIFSRAGRVSQRAKGAWIYLIDDRGKRFSPVAGAVDVPLDVLLKPGESVDASRVFRVPADAQGLGLITGHGGGGYCGAMSILIIGQSGCLFDKPAMIRLQ
jgi:hypothetical protein